MADSVVSFLLGNLTQLLTQESNLLGGVQDQVRILHNELEMISVFLRSTEGNRDDNLVKVVVSQIRDVAYEIEDVIDTFIVTATKHSKRSKLRKLIYSFDRVTTLHEVASKTESIKKVIKEIYDNRSKYGIIEIAQSGGGDAEAEGILHKRRRYVEEDEVVGFGHDTQALLKQLLEGGLQRDVTSIIGMGGLGKTTLARKIYNNNHVENNFNFRRWVYVSQEYRIRELLLEILKGVKIFILKTELKEELFHGLEVKYSTLFEDLQCMKEKDDGEFKDILLQKVELIHGRKSKKSFLVFVQNIYKRNGEGLQDMNDDELKRGLFNFLQVKRYLIVLDDIWKTDVWDELKVAFPDNMKGSRILITSRIKEVAAHASPNIPPYFLPFLNKDESWELFSKKVFRGGTCPAELEALGRQIAESCDGLPLAIVVLGGLLANKEKTHRTWSKLIGHVNWYLTQDRSDCLDILALSYNHLPRRLKPCFLYFGIFPEDFEIPVRQLIRLWIAEGFIQHNGDRNVEDVAEDYLEELIDRSLIQVATTRTDGGVKTCRIHDLLRDLCITESKEEKFFEVCSDFNDLHMSKSRRLSINCATGQCISSNLCDSSSNCRSLLRFGFEYKSNLKWLCKMFKLVRVVHSGDADYSSIPKKIEKLILLRYLRIPGEFDVIPASICSLWNLVTLDMRSCGTKVLPKEIWMLQKLRHLYLGGPTSIPRTDNKALPNLQVLTGIDINEDTKYLFAKARFPNLRKLGLYYCYHRPELENLSSFHNLCQLKTLKIYRLCHLQSPYSIHLTLTKVTLVEADLSSTVFTMLGSFPNLRILKLLGVYSDRGRRTLHCSESSFRQLEVFVMAHLLIVSWELGKGAMPSLRRLVIDRCPLSEFPEELWCLTALRDVQVLQPSLQLANRLEGLQMKNGCKLQVYTPLESGPGRN
uniref:NB-ARC domain-containing protein n=1 Tax=Fagus sylvatica TaxID=28930 RepID=A0A2N9H2G9_FAGSY